MGLGFISGGFLSFLIIGRQSQVPQLVFHDLGFGFFIGSSSPLFRVDYRGFYKPYSREGRHQQAWGGFLRQGRFEGLQG